MLGIFSDPEIRGVLLLYGLPLAVLWFHVDGRYRVRAWRRRHFPPTSTAKVIPIHSVNRDPDRPSRKKVAP